MQVQTKSGIAAVLGEWRAQLGDLHRSWKEDRRARGWASFALGAAFLIVFVAIAIDLARYFDFHHRRARFLSLTTDQGLPELVMDGLALMASLALIRLYLRAGLRGFLCFAVVLLIVALDDLLGYHENIGSYLVDRLHLSDLGDLKAEAIGELIFLAGLGACLLPFFAWCVWKPSAPNLAVFLTYGLIFGIFVLFAGGVDALHSLADSSVMDRLLGWIEDGGEIISIGILTAVALLQLHGRRFS